MDLCVTVPKSFGLSTWIAEGDPAGCAEWSGNEWDFYLWGAPPEIKPFERVYIVAHGKLRGYAPLVRIQRYDGRRYSLVRHGGAVAVTLVDAAKQIVHIKGFRGYQYRWWTYEEEQAFPDWQKP